MRRRVVMVLNDLAGGGTQRVATTMANAWAARGDEVTLALVSPETDAWTVDPRIRRIDLGLRRGTRTLLGALRDYGAVVLRLRRLLRDVRPELAIGFIAHINVLLVLAGLGLGLRIAVSERNDPSRQSFGPIWDRLRRWLYPLADIVTANSQSALDALSTYVPRQRLALLPNPLAAPPAPGNREKLVLAVGRLHRQKAYDVLIEAFARIAAEHSDWSLRIAGEGEERGALERAVSRHRLTDRVTLLGYVADPAPLYAAAGIFVMASRHEGTPNALLEAMAAGLPCVVSDGVGGGLDFLRDEVSGLVVPREQADALGRAMARLMEDAALRLRIGEAARSATVSCALPRVLGEWDSALELQPSPTG